MPLEFRKESSNPSHGISKYGFPLRLSGHKGLFEGEFIDQLILPRRIEQKHKAAVCAATELPDVVIIIDQSQCGIAGFVTYGAIPEIQFSYSH